MTRGPGASSDRRQDGCLEVLIPLRTLCLGGPCLLVWLHRPVAVPAGLGHVDANGMEVTIESLGTGPIAVFLREFGNSHDPWGEKRDCGHPE